MTTTAKILFSDCLLALPKIEDETVDAVVTDPPYCSGGFSESGKKSAKGQGLRSETLKKIGWFANDNMTTGGLVWLLRACMVEAERILKPGGSALIFTDWRMVPALAPALESSGLRYQNQIVWDKGSPGLGTGFRPQHEMILHYVKGSAVFHDCAAGNVIRCPRTSRKIKTHQTEKPVQLLESLIRVVSPEGGTVLDMFAGSGSTGEACQNLGRNFIGIEKAEKYAIDAAERLKRFEPVLL